MEHKDRIFTAIGFCIAAHFLFFIMGAFAKILTENHHVAEIVFYRNLLAFVPLFLYLYLKKKTHLFKTKKPRLVLFRAIMGVFSLMLTYQALYLLPMSYATILFFTSTILTPALAVIILKEKVGIHRWAAVLAGMCGVLIIAQPSGEINAFGVTLALTAALIHAVMFITLRSLKTESPVAVSFWFFCAGVVIPAFAMPFIGTLPAPSEIWMFIVVGISGGLAQLCLASAYKYAAASLVTPFAYSALIWNIIADIIIWNFPLDFFAIAAGTLLLLFAQIYILYRETLNKQKATRHE